MPRNKKWKELEIENTGEMSLCFKSSLSPKESLWLAHPNHRLWVQGLVFSRVALGWQWQPHLVYKQPFLGASLPSQLPAVPSVPPQPHTRLFCPCSSLNFIPEYQNSPDREQNPREGHREAAVPSCSLDQIFTAGKIPWVPPGWLYSTAQTSAADLCLCQALWKL